MKHPDAHKMNTAKEKMPSQIKTMLESARTEELIEYISEKYDVSHFQVTLLITYVLTGFLPVMYLSQELQDECDVSLEEAHEIAREIRGHLFAYMINDLAPMQSKAQKTYLASQKTK